MLKSEPFVDFGKAATATLNFLHQRFGFALWMVTRTEGKDWIVLEALDHHYQVGVGDNFNWEDSLCSRMVKDIGPRIAPDCRYVPTYVDAPIYARLPIGAYIGVPLMREDGGLFGTLCAIDPQPQPDSLMTEQPMIEIFARLLSTQLTVDLKATEAQRFADRARVEAMTDALTGLYNRRGWLELTAAEEERCRRLGYPACIFSVDLDHLKTINDTQGHAAGDDLIRRTGDTLRHAVRQQDIVARLGGDEFLICCIECDRVVAQQIHLRIEQALGVEGIRASLGMAMRDTRLGLAHAVEVADDAMYISKAARKPQK